MRIVEPDFARRIDLPGAGPCPRPVDIDQAVTGFADLVSLRVYSFAAGVAIEGEAEGDELFIVLMRGAIDLKVAADGQFLGAFSLDGEGVVRAIYMPPGSGYHLTARADADVAYARVRGGDGPALPVAAFAEREGRAAGMIFTLATLAPGATLSLGEGPERLLHLRSADGHGEIGGMMLADWHTAAVDRGEAAALTALDGDVEVLLVAATA